MYLKKFSLIGVQEFIMRILSIITSLLMTSLLLASVSHANTLAISGSSTVYPFAKEITAKTKAKTGVAPSLKSSGSSSGIKDLCAGRVAIANASRRIKADELQLCDNSNVKLSEYWVGRDGIVISTHISNDALKSITRKQLYQATVAQLYVKGVLTENPYTLWSDISPELPEIEIVVYGPDIGYGTRDALQKLALEIGASSSIHMIALRNEDGDTFKTLFNTLREDGAYIGIPDNDPTLAGKIEDNPNAIAISSYSYFDKNRKTLKGVAVEGVKPNFEHILSGYYKLSRPLYFYLNIKNFQDSSLVRSYVQTFIAKNAISEKGFLVKKGLIPLSNAEFSLEAGKATKPIRLRPNALQ